MKLIKKFKIGPDNKFTLYIGMSDGGKLRIGSKREWRMQHMHSFQLIESGWFNILFTFQNLDRISIHLQYRSGNWWCNVGKDLPPDNDVFPYVFLSAIDLKVLDRTVTKELEEVKNWESLRHL